MPEELHRKLYPSLRFDAHPQANAEIRAMFADPPTLNEFTRAIASLPTKSVAESTGLQYGEEMVPKGGRGSTQSLDCAV